MGPEEIERRLDLFTQRLRDAGIKLTSQRMAIFRAIAASEQHPDAETLYGELKESCPSLSIDTVYRSLWLLAELGLVSTVGQRHEAVRFDVNLSRHHHFVCIRCGSIQDFYSPQLDRLDVAEEVQDFGAFISSQVEVRGICKKCETGTDQ